MSQSVKLSNGNYIDAEGVWDATNSKNVQATLNTLQSYIFNAGKDMKITLDATPVLHDRRVWFVICNFYSATGQITGASLFFISTSYSGVGYLFDVAGTTTASAGISIATSGKTITVTFSGYKAASVYPMQ